VELGGGRCVGRHGEREPVLIRISVAKGLGGAEERREREAGVNCVGVEHLDASVRANADSDAVPEAETV